MSHDPKQAPWKPPSRPRPKNYLSVADTVESKAMAQLSAPKFHDHSEFQINVNQQDPQADIQQSTQNGHARQAEIHQLKEAQYFPLPNIPTQSKNERTVPLSSVPEQLQNVKAASRNGVWKPGTFGFDDLATDDEIPAKANRETLPMMVLTGIFQAQGKPKPVMQSEISGAAGAAGLVGLGNILGTGFKYTATFLIQYGFGPSIYGLYTLGTAMVNLFASIFNLGLGDAMVRYTSIYRSKRKFTLLKGLTIFCTALSGVAGIVGGLLLLFFTPSLIALDAARHSQSANNGSTFAQAVPMLQMMAPLVPIFCMQVVWVGGLRGLKVFKWRVISGNIVQPVVQIALIGCMLFFFHDIVGIALALLISNILSVVLNLFFLYRQVARVATPEPGRYEARDWMVFASLNSLTTIIDTFLITLDTILLAYFGIPIAQIGQYGAANRITLFISLPLLSINNIFAPTIAELHSTGERQKLELMFKVMTKWTIMISLPIFLVAVLFAPYILGLSGAGFLPAWPLVIALAIGALVNVGTGAVGYMLLMTGYNKLSFLNSLVAVIVNITLGIILTPRYGSMGIAIGSGIAICVLNLMRLLQVRLLLKMQPYRWDTLKPICAGLTSSLIIGALLLLLSNFKLSTMLGHAVLSAQLLLIPVLVAIYIGLLILFKGSPEDEIVMIALRKKLLRSKK